MGKWASTFTGNDFNAMRHLNRHSVLLIRWGMDFHTQGFHQCEAAVLYCISAEVRAWRRKALTAVMGPKWRGGPQDICGKLSVGNAEKWRDGSVLLQIAVQVFGSFKDGRDAWGGKILGEIAVSRTL